VKALANQTARSTEEITRHITQVRAATGASVAAVARIEQTITEVNAIASSVAAAVEQQGTATGEIARSVTETAAAAHEMTGRTDEVSAEARETGRQAARVHEDSEALSRAVADLKHGVVRVVRTSTEEVERRGHRRYATELSGRLVLAGGAAHEVHVVDLSADGARLADAPELPAQTSGMLHLAAVPFPLPFTVRDGGSGTLNLVFALDASAAAAFAPLPERLALHRAA
jgi:methyl-accepting chemotaxis protein